MDFVGKLKTVRGMLDDAANFMVEYSLRRLTGERFVSWFCAKHRPLILCSGGEYIGIYKRIIYSAGIGNDCLAIHATDVATILNVGLIHGLRQLILEEYQGGLPHHRLLIWEEAKDFELEPKARLLWARWCLITCKRLGTEDPGTCFSKEITTTSSCFAGISQTFPVGAQSLSHAYTVIRFQCLSRSCQIPLDHGADELVLSYNIFVDGFLWIIKKAKAKSGNQSVALRSRQEEMPKAGPFGGAGQFDGIVRTCYQWNSGLQPYHFKIVQVEALMWKWQTGGR